MTDVNITKNQRKGASPTSSPSGSSRTFRDNPSFRRKVHGGKKPPRDVAKVLSFRTPRHQVKRFVRKRPRPLLMVLDVRGNLHAFTNTCVKNQLVIYGNPPNMIPKKKTMSNTDISNKFAHDCQKTLGKKPGARGHCLTCGWY